MARDSDPLDFDPIELAGQIWEAKIGEAGPMRLATSIMRVQQLVLGRLDAALKPHGITFARYEVLRLISFSREGRLPLARIGERLMVHPTSVTNAIDRLEDQGLVLRVADPSDRRRTFAELTEQGAQVVAAATDALMAIDFAIDGLTDQQQSSIYGLLREVRRSAGDFS